MGRPSKVKPAAVGGNRRDFFKRSGSAAVALGALPAAALSPFGMAEAGDIRAEDMRFTPRGSEWRLTMGGERHGVRLPLRSPRSVMGSMRASSVPA